MRTGIDKRVGHRGSSTVLGLSAPSDDTVRRELALEVPYPDDYYQDGVWSAEIQKSVRTHAFVDRDLYFYDYRIRDRARSVGWWPYPKEKVRWL